MRQPILEGLRRRFARRVGPEESCRVDVMEAALESIAEGAVVVNAAGRMIYMNAAAREMTGDAPLEPDPRRWADAFGLYEPDGTTPLRYEDSALLAALGGKVGGHYAVIRNGKHPEGLCVACQARPIYDQEGEIFGAVATFRDVTKCLGHKERLARLSGIVEASPDAIFARALDGTILEWNPAAERLFGWTAAEAVGRPASSLLAEESGREVAGELAEQARRGGTVHAETRVRAKDGRLVAVSITAFPCRGAEGRLLGISSIARSLQGERT